MPCCSGIVNYLEKFKNELSKTVYVPQKPSFDVETFNVSNETFSNAVPHGVIWKGRDHGVNEIRKKI